MSTKEGIYYVGLMAGMGITAYVIGAYNIFTVGACCIVGLATGYHLTQRHPDMRVVVLEKETELGAHQSGHNSGVLHSGIYYKPGSLKALNCRTGKEAMERFCKENDVAFDQ